MNTKLYKQIVILFLKSKTIVISSISYTFILFSKCLIILLDWNNQTSPLNDFAEVLKFSFFTFIVCSFVAYEFSYKVKRNNVEECLRIQHKAYMTLIKTQILILHGFVFICMLVTLLGGFIITVKYNCWSTSWILEMFLNIFLSFLMIPYCGVLMGVVVSKYFKRVNGYLFMLLFLVLCSPMMNDIAITLYELNINIYPLIFIFNFFPPALDWTPIYAFGSSILPYRWILTIFWICIFVVLLLCHLNNKTVKDKLKISISLILSAFCIVLLLQPMSILLLDSDDPERSIMADWEYYYVIYPNDKIESANFEIDEYNLDVHIGNEMKVTAKLTVDSINLKEYRFTLYHKFKIDKVLDDNGKEINFEQNGDYITLYIYESLCKSFTFYYHGHSSIYYTNQQGVFLPGYFPYYPQSGWRKVYDRDYQGFAQSKLEKPAFFNVNINCNKEIYSNLEKQGKNKFSGYTDGLTLLAGHYSTYTKDGVKIVFPYLNVDYNDKNIEKYVCDLFGTNALPNSIKTVFITPSINNISPYTYYCQFSDSVTLQSIYEIERAYGAQQLCSNKQALYDIYRSYLKDSDAIRAHVTTKQNEFSKMYPNERYEDVVPLGADEYLVKYLDYYGEEKGLKKIEEYLQSSTTDDIYWKDFIKNTN